jgi:transposase-like protein
MPRVKCPKCAQFENIHKAGIVRNKQRYNCKNCNYHFIQDKKKTKNATDPARNDKQTSMQDIAHAAGVSIATVSRALKDKSDKLRKSYNIKIKCKNLKIDITNLIFSMQEYMNPEVIDSLDYDINIDNLVHLKNTTDDISWRREVHRYPAEVVVINDIPETLMYLLTKQ